MKRMAIIRLNDNFVGDCNRTEDGERYIILRHKLGIDFPLLNKSFQEGFFYVNGQLIPITSIGSILLAEEK